MIGDEVEVEDPRYTCEHPEGLRGVVSSQITADGFYAISFHLSDDFFHDCDGLCPLNKGYYMEVESLKLVKAEAKEESNSALDKQIQGNHYKDMKIQPIEFIQANELNFCEGNCIKYLVRYKNKNGLEDLKKARHYINLLIELEYGKEEI